MNAIENALETVVLV